jgi:outer membrane protein OmpA-like peptidoglycan-associated protein
MISLLMAFFVMLLTMSTARSGKLCNEDEAIFDRTLSGFRSSIEGFGVPGLFAGAAGLFGGAGDAVDLGRPKTYYPISDANDDTGRTIDAQTERVRRMFQGLQERSETYKSQVRGLRPDFSITPIAFAQGQWLLDESAKRFLTEFVANLQKSSPDDMLKLYVVGTAFQESGEKQQWIVSTRRAEAVAGFLREALRSKSRCQVYAWGCGPGGDWTGPDSPMSKGSQILIAVLRAGD